MDAYARNEWVDELVLTDVSVAGIYILSAA
jgi:hypothetical protein